MSSDVAAQVFIITAGALAGIVLLVAVGAYLVSPFVDKVRRRRR